MAPSAVQARITRSSAPRTGQPASFMRAKRMLPIVRIAGIEMSISPSTTTTIIPAASSPTMATLCWSE